MLALFAVTLALKVAPPLVTLLVDDELTVGANGDAAFGQEAPSFGAVSVGVEPVSNTAFTTGAVCDTCAAGISYILEPVFAKKNRSPATSEYAAPYAVVGAVNALPVDVVKVTAFVVRTCVLRLTI